MSIEFKGANAVVIAREPFTPAVFSQAWMIRHLHTDPDDFSDQGAFQSPFLFSAQTRSFGLLVIPERVQLNIRPVGDDGAADEGAMVRRVTMEVLRHIPQLNSAGAGLNFNWIINGDGRPNRETTRRLFFTEGNPLLSQFNQPDACFGAYASKDYMGARLRVEAKPVHEPNNEPAGTQTIFNFNFNVDLTGDDQLGEIDRLLGHWDNARQEASRIIHLVSRECGL